VNGKFDATVSTVAFLKGVLYHGSVTVDPDARGLWCSRPVQEPRAPTASQSSATAKIWGMSQDPGNLWTYRVRRISPER
jgi:hypothetical protein